MRWVGSAAAASEVAVADVPARGSWPRRRPRVVVAAAKAVVRAATTVPAAVELVAFEGCSPQSWPQRQSQVVVVVVVVAAPRRPRRGPHAQRPPRRRRWPREATSAGRVRGVRVTGHGTWPSWPRLPLRRCGQRPAEDVRGGGRAPRRRPPSPASVATPCARRCGGAGRAGPHGRFSGGGPTRPEPNPRRPRCGGCCRPTSTAATTTSTCGCGREPGRHGRAREAAVAPVAEREGGSGGSWRRQRAGAREGETGSERPRLGRRSPGQGAGRERFERRTAGAGGEGER